MNNKTATLIAKSLAIISLFLMVLKAENPIVQASPKDWNFMVCMANNNNLHRYGIQNFKQMMKSGSSKSLNVLLQMDEYGQHNCSRFLIEPNAPLLVEKLTQSPYCISGTPENLFHFASWGITSYPSKHTLMVLWNHGAGIKDPQIWGKL